MAQKKQQPILIGILAILVLVVGVVVFKVAFAPKAPALPIEEEQIEELPQVDASVEVTLTESKSKANAVVISVTGLDSKYTTIGYELTYDSEGLIKGVNSGSKPMDVAGEDSFEREIYLGTCSRNVCTPDKGVSTVSVILEFTDTEGAKSQFEKEYTL